MHTARVTCSMPACRVGPHIVTNYHCIAKVARDTTNTLVRPLLLSSIAAVPGKHQACPDVWCRRCP